MNKTILAFALTLGLALCLAGCGKARTGEAEPPAAAPQSTAEVLNPAVGGEATVSPAQEEPAAPGRQDGERFEAIIMLEGMEEPVRYEHLINTAAGFEMDYEYESLTRQSEGDRERFLSVWDEPESPVNYLEVTASAEDAETAAASVREALSQTYDLSEGTRELDRAGSCIYIEASVLKGSDRMADQLQTVYIIPASDGCRIATAHYTIESAEGFARRFAYMLNTLSVLDR